MEWIIGCCLVAFNVLLMLEVMETKKACRMLVVELYMIGTGESTWENFTQRLDASSHFNEFREEFRRL